MQRLNISIINAATTGGALVASADAIAQQAKLAIAKLHPNVAATEQSVNIFEPGQFLSKCEGSLGDYHTAVQDKIPPMNVFDAVICAGAANETAEQIRNRVADVTYALYSKQIPVLLLTHEKQTAPTFHPLVETAIGATESDVASAVTQFLTFPEQRGKVIVVEGGDGAGKQTQVKMLYDRLLSENTPAATLDYPHDSAKYGVLIRELLSGKMGSIRDVDPLMFASLYGLNRHDTLPRLKYWIQKGKNIILDRYVSANFGHQASKLGSDEERNAVIQKLSRFEFNWLGLPDVDAVLYLNLPADFSLKAMQQDSTRQELDMHEKAGIEYKNNVRRAFLWCCETQRGWKEVRCVNEDETVRYSREDVHKDIYGKLESIFVNKGADSSN